MCIVRDYAGSNKLFHVEYGSTFLDSPLLPSTPLYSPRLPMTLLDSRRASTVRGTPRLMRNNFLLPVYSFSGVPCDRNILLISARAIIINHIFASKCYYMSATWVYYVSAASGRMIQDWKKRRRVRRRKYRTAAERNHKVSTLLMSI